MQERVSGVVTHILGGDIFEMQVTNEGTFNENNYRNLERVRIAGIDDPELYPGNPGYSIDKLKDREVQCFVLARDANGNAVAVVRCLN